MDRVSSFLGFAQRSGKLASGAQGYVLHCRRAKSMLDYRNRLLSKHSGPIYSNGRQISVPCYRYGSKVSLGQAIGKAPRSLIAVLDSGFARAIAAEVDR